MLKLKATVRSEALTVTPTDKGDWKRRTVKLLGDDLPEQFLEISLDESHAPVGVGKTVELRVKRIVGVWQGNVRLDVEPLQSEAK